MRGPAPCLGKRTLESRPGKGKHKEKHQQRAQKEQEPLSQPELPDAGLLEFFQEGERAELDRTKAPQGEQMQHQRDCRGSEAEQDERLKEYHDRGLG